MPSSVTIVATLPLEPGRVYTAVELATLREAALIQALDRVPTDALGGHWVGPLHALYGGDHGVVTASRAYGWPDDGVTGVDYNSPAVARLTPAVRRALPGFAGWFVDKRPTAIEDMQATPSGRILIMFYTEESSVLQGSAPNAQNIQAGFERLTRYSTPERGHWVGVAPRIVRQGVLTGSNKTHAAWLYEFPDTPWVRANITQLVSDVQAAVQTGLVTETARVNTLGIAQPAAWDRVTATAYDPARNGSYEFWACGGPPGSPCASVTRTTTEFPNVTSTEYVENPIGPDSALTHPLGSQDIWNDIKGFFTSPKFGWGLAIVGGIAALVYIAPLVATWTAARRTPARRNPQRRVPAVGTRVIFEPTDSSRRDLRYYPLTRYPAPGEHGVVTAVPAYGLGVGGHHRHDIEDDLVHVSWQDTGDAWVPVETVHEASRRRR